MTVYLKGFGVNYKISRFITCAGKHTVKIKIFRDNNFVPAMTSNAFTSVDDAVQMMESKGYEIYAIN